MFLLQRKHGVSMRAWIYRVRELDIISEATAKRFWIRFREEGRGDVEPGAQLPTETPGRLTRLVLRALAEEFITRLRAVDLLGPTPI